MGVFWYTYFVRIHHRSRTIAIRLVFIFIGTFAGAFFLLNIRFVEKNVQYWAAPGTIRTKSTLGQAIRLLPVAQGAETMPLPDNARLVVDSIGVNAPIVFGVQNNNDLIYKQLENGVVHYSATAKPGNTGTAIVLGHSSAYPWYKGDYGAVFALLSKLNVGDRFYVQYSDGRTFIFEMESATIFNPFTDDQKIKDLEEVPGSNIILLSCYPVGTNYLRIAIFARQVGTNLQ